MSGTWFRGAAGELTCRHCDSVRDPSRAVMGAVVSGHPELGRGSELEVAMNMGDAVLTERGSAEKTSKPRPVLLGRREQWLAPSRCEEDPGKKGRQSQEEDVVHSVKCQEGS